LYNQIIFKEKEDYEMYFGLLKKYKEQYGVKMYAYCLMPSHVHLLLEVDEQTSISAAMHDLNSAYTKYFNSRYERKGHLFRERYKAAIVEKTPLGLLNLSAYIHLNPKRLNLAISAESYPHSTYVLYLNYEQSDDHGLNIKEEVAEVLKALVGENYKDFMEKIETSGDLSPMHKQLHRKKILGTEEFINRVKEQIENQQEELAETEADTTGEPNKMPLGLGTAVLILAIAASGVYVYFNYWRSSSMKKEAVVSTPNTVASEDELMDLDRTEWEVMLISAIDKTTISDTISFKDGKFSSLNLLKQNYIGTNYSLIKEGSKIIWETMQTSLEGTASWRGELEDEKMIGMLNLRQEGEKPQDFSFKSMRFIKK